MSLIIPRVLILSSKYESQYSISKQIMAIIFLGGYKNNPKLIKYYLLKVGVSYIL